MLTPCRYWETSLKPRETDDYTWIQPRKRQQAESISDIMPPPAPKEKSSPVKPLVLTSQSVLVIMYSSTHLWSARDWWSNKESWGQDARRKGMPTGNLNLCRSEACLYPSPLSKESSGFRAWSLRARHTPPVNTFFKHKSVRYSWGLYCQPATAEFRSCQ